MAFGKKPSRMASLAIIEYIRQSIMSGISYEDIVPAIATTWSLSTRTAQRHITRFKKTLVNEQSRIDPDLIKNILSVRYTDQHKRLQECYEMAENNTEKVKTIEQQRKVCDSLAQLYGIGNSRTSSVTNNTIAFLLPDNNTQELFNDKKNSFIEVKAEETPPEGVD